MPRSDLVLTKVLATLGPSTADPEVVTGLIAEGARVLRLNFSHGGFDAFEKTLVAARQGIAASGLPVGILGDLSGPKIRCRGVVGGAVELAPGDTVEFVAGNDDAVVVTPGRVRLGTTYDPIVEEVEPGHRVLINDGAIRMLATMRREAEHSDGDGRAALLCRVTHGNTLSPAKGINLPDTHVSAPRSRPGTASVPRGRLSTTSTFWRSPSCGRPPTWRSCSTSWRRSAATTAR